MSPHRFWRATAIGAVSLALTLGLGAFKLHERWKAEHARARLAAALGPDVPRAQSFAPVNWPKDALRIVFAGDSRVADWPLPQPPEGMAFVNRGLGGETSRQFRNRLPDLLQGLDPDLLVLSLGVNDLYAGVLTPELLGNIKSEYIDNIKYIESYTLDHGADLILLSILQPAEPSLALRRFAWSDAIYAEVADMNTHLTAMASPPQTRVFDVNAALGATPEGPLNKNMAADAMHPNASAYAMLAEALIEEVLKP